MNNVEEFYKKKKLFETVRSHSHKNNAFFWRVHTEARGVRIALEDDFVNSLEGREQETVLEIIQAGLNRTEKRHEIENHLIEALEEDFEMSRKQIKKDFGIVPPAGKGDY